MSDQHESRSETSLNWRCRLFGHRWGWRKNAHNVVGTWVDEWCCTRCGTTASSYELPWERVGRQIGEQKRDEETTDA